MRRLLPTRIVPIHLTGASQVIWGSSNARVGVCLFVPSGITLWLSDTNPAVVAQGLPVSNQTYPYIFDTDRFGDFPSRTIFGISSGVADGGILEILDPDQMVDSHILGDRAIIDAGLPVRRS